MGHYTIELGMYTLRCANCGIMYGVPNEYDDERRKDGESFYCPNGHSQVYKVTETQRLKEQLDEAQRKAMRQQERALCAETRADRLDKQYHRVRSRIMAGVCPCCNRTFPNVAAHMATKHPEFSPGERLRALREAFGLIQSALADEAGVNTAYISSFENSKPVPEWAGEALAEWMARQVKEPAEN